MKELSIPNFIQISSAPRIAFNSARFASRFFGRLANEYYNTKNRPVSGGLEREVSQHREDGCDGGFDCFQGLILFIFLIKRLFFVEFGSY